MSGRLLPYRYILLIYMCGNNLNDIDCLIHRLTCHLSLYRYIAYIDIYCLYAPSCSLMFHIYCLY